jgi:hypothetical protein
MTLSRFRQLVVPVCCAVALLAAPGCGGSGTKVTGTVTYNGQPVEDGYITFYPSDGKAAPAGGDVKGGKFTVYNVAVGNNRVEVASRNKPIEGGSSESKNVAQGNAILSAAEGNNQVHDIKDGMELKLDLKTGPPGSQTGPNISGGPTGGGGFNSGGIIKR